MSTELTIVIASACGSSPPVGWLAYRVVRRWHTPAELRGDWWSRFENDFRGYVSSTEHRRDTSGGGTPAKPE